MRRAERRMRRARQRREERAAKAEPFIWRAACCLTLTSLAKVKEIQDLPEEERWAHYFRARHEVFEKLRSMFARASDQARDKIRERYGALIEQTEKALNGHGQSVDSICQDEAEMRK